MGGGRNSWSDRKVFWPVIDHSAPMHPIVFNSHLGYFTLNWCSCAHSKELRPGLYPCGSVTALESVQTEGEWERNIERRGERLRSKFPQINQSISSSVLTCHILCPFQNYLLFQEGINVIYMNFLCLDRASKGKIVRAHGEIKEMIYSPVLVLLLSSLCIIHHCSSPRGGICHQRGNF